MDDFPTRYGAPGEGAIVERQRQLQGVFDDFAAWAGGERYPLEAIPFARRRLTLIPWNR